ncbi:hypothetical protein EDD15DRAFT_2195708 [Pisolithus albus]|nr:hypothetical protein EDD15DRAFT_2195708 [Pisolithus albus]
MSSWSYCRTIGSPTVASSHRYSTHRARAKRPRHQSKPSGSQKQHGMTRLELVVVKMSLFAKLGSEQSTVKHLEKAQRETRRAQEKVRNAQQASKEVAEKARAAQAAAEKAARDAAEYARAAREVQEEAGKRLQSAGYSGSSYRYWTK